VNSVVPKFWFRFPINVNQVDTCIGLVKQGPGMLNEKNGSAMESDAGGQLDEPVTPADSAASQMRAAREKAGLTLVDIAARTRVPLRHLEALERGDYGALPGITYCAGFARAFARTVGMDEVALVAQIRRDAEEAGDFASTQFQIDEPLDPARIPPRTLAWIAAIIALLVVGGYALWRMQLNAPPAAQESVAPAPQRPASAPKQAAAPVAANPGPVTLTATEDLWLRIYDGDSKALYEGMMKRGESFTVPPAARNPMILTGRADALAVTVGGRPVPPLGTAEKTIVDFPISAPALLGRTTVQPAAPQPPATTAPPAAPGARRGNQPAASAAPPVQAAAPAAIPEAAAPASSTPDQAPAAP
jgi:cytoskeleton protein RodZ